MFPTPRSFSHPLCEHSMSSRKQKTTTLLLRILKRKGSRGGFKESAGCRTPLWHSHSWLCSWVSFLHRVRSSPSFLLCSVIPPALSEARFLCPACLTGAEGTGAARFASSEPPTILRPKANGLLNPLPRFDTNTSEIPKTHSQ